MSVAMFGCVLLLAPSLQVGNSYGLLAVSAALFSGGAHTCLRLLKNESPMIVVLWFQIHGCLRRTAPGLPSATSPSAKPFVAYSTRSRGLCHYWPVADDQCL